MGDLRELYQEVIIDHGKRPRNFGSLEGASHRADGYNPLCGDRMTLFVKLEDGVVQDVRFEGSGCAISTASSSMLTEILKDKTEAEARQLAKDFVALVTAERGDDAGAESLGKLAVFAGVKSFPSRVKCATLAWHTLEFALDGEIGEASSE
jgi:nitrogen fixation NifU-like protein